MRDDGRDGRGVIAGLLFFRAFRCTDECAWHGYRFSRSRLRRQKRRVQKILLVALFVAVAAVTVRYAITHVGAGPSKPQDDGIREE
jgi:hypothetical protein